MDCIQYEAYQVMSLFFALFCTDDSVGNNSLVIVPDKPFVTGILHMVTRNGPTEKQRTLIKVWGKYTEARKLAKEQAEDASDVICSIHEILEFLGRYQFPSFSWSPALDILAEAMSTAALMNMSANL
ncbi:hypothetical protein HDU97_005877 [Phlyctochytrium planicorne]|nr:hypothetical protein HDU97_005877 [Phlyctochytrium planicorne]